MGFKLVYVMILVWNGGVGPQGVHSGFFTFRDMELCETIRPEMVANVEEFHGQKPKVISDCIEITIPPIEIAI